MLRGGILGTHARLLVQRHVLDPMPTALGVVGGRKKNESRRRLVTESRRRARQWDFKYASVKPCSWQLDACIPPWP